MPLNQPTEFLKAIKVLAEAGADFVVIGGLGVAMHGGTRITKDVDFAFIRKRDNAKAIATALSSYHPKPFVWPEGLPFVWDDQTLMNSTTLTLDTDLARIDFLAEPDGANNYKEMKSRAATFDLDGHTIYVASIEDLLAMKRAAGRPQDVQDIAQLETIKRLREEE